MATIRTFICFDLPPDVRAQLQEVQTQLTPFGSGVAWVKPEGIHLTLKFLGDVQAGQMDVIAAAAERAAMDACAVPVTVQNLGAFPHFRRPRVLWAGIQERSGVLNRLQQQIEMELAQLGYPREERPFSPHLTLARVKDFAASQAVVARFQKLTFAPVTFRPAAIIVMRSDLRPEGAVYSPMRTIEL